jgi:hypothetical protein
VFSISISISIFGGAGGGRGGKESGLVCSVSNWFAMDEMHLMGRVGWRVDTYIPTIRVLHAIPYCCAFPAVIYLLLVDVCVLVLYSALSMYKYKYK